MANNEYVNKVDFGNDTLIDITSTTAEEGDVIEGKSFFLKSGAPATGTLGDATTSTHGLMSAADKIKLNNVNPNTISVAAFGAAGDGTTDDSVAIQAAFNSGAYDIYFESNKTYYLADNVVIHRDIKLHGGENTYIKTVSPANGTANNGISITGTLKKTTTLTSDYVSNGTNQDNCDNRFTLTDMTDIAIGDILEIEATDQYYSYARSYYHLGGIIIITNIYNGHLFTCDKLPFDITNTENVTVKVYSAPQAVVENLHFISDLNSVNGYTYLLKLAHCKNTTIKDCTFKQMLNGMIVGKCVNTKLDNIRLQESKYNNSDDRDGYGIVIDSSTNTIIERILATCAQHAISISGQLPSINTYVRNCNLTAECRAPGLDTHEAVYNLVIEDSVLGGAALNGTVTMNNCKVINNRRVSDGIDGITIYGSHNPAFSKIRITNTDFTNSAVTLYHIVAQNPVQSFDSVFDSIEIENCQNGRLHIIPSVTATVLSNTVNKLSLINWKDCYEIYYLDVCKIKTFIVHDCNFTSSFITDHAGHRYMTNIEYMDYVKTNPVQHKIIINRDTKGEHLLLPRGIPITVSSSDSSAKYIVCGQNLVSDDIQDYLVGTVSGSAGGNISRSAATGDSIPTISMNENKNVVYSQGSGTGKYCVYPIGLYHAVEGGNMIMSTTLINSGTTNGAKFTPYMAMINGKTGKLIDRYTGTGATATSEGADIGFSRQVGSDTYILCYYYCSTSVANSITTFSNPVILFSSSLTPNLSTTVPPYTAQRRTGDGLIYSLPGINNILCSTTNFHVEIKADFINNTQILPHAATNWSGAMSAADKTKLDGIATGATANTGTITGITMNSESKGTNGVVDLGTVVTDVSDKANKTDLSNIEYNINPYVDIDTPADIITINDAIEDGDIALKFNVEPIQDLHGYSNPWPAGGGKNKIEAVGEWNVGSDGAVHVAQGYTSVIAKITQGQTYTPSKNGVSAIPQTMGFYSTYPVVGAISYDGQRVIPSSATFTAPIDGYIMARMATSIETGYQIELGSTVTDYIPYSNICPISGWDKAEVGNSGSNFITPISPVETFDLTGSGVYRYGQSFVGGKTYTIVNNTAYQVPYRTPKANLSDRGTTAYIASNQHVTVSVPSDNMLWVFETSEAAWRINRELININTVGDTTFHKPVVYAIPFRSTMYGGYITVGKDGEVDLMVDRVKYTIPSTIELDYSATTKTYYFSHDALSADGTGTDYNSAFDGICDRLKSCGANTAWATATEGLIGWVDSRKLRFKLPNIADNDTTSAKACVVGMQVVYKIATPITYRLNPLQIKSLLGTNNIWADTGTIEELLYTKLTSGLLSSEDKYKLDNLISIDPYVTIDNPLDIVEIDNAAAAKVREMEIEIAPVQDLHGYEYPWIGGIGKNKGLLDSTTVYSEQQRTVSYINNGAVVTSTGNYGRVGFSFSVISGNKYTISFKAKKNVVGGSLAGIYFGSTTAWEKEYGSFNGSSLSTTLQNYTKTITASSNVLVVGIYPQSNGNSITVENFQLESGSTATIFEPYSNICPISGWTGAKISDTRKNLIDWKVSPFSDNKLETWLNKGSYVLSAKSTLSNGYWYIKAQNVDGTYLTKEDLGLSDFGISGSDSYVYYGAANYQTFPFSIPVDGVSVKIGRLNSDGSIPAQLEFGTEATTFEDFEGAKYSITFPNEAGTVYGGILTVNQDGTGSLIVDRFAFKTTSDIISTNSSITDISQRTNTLKFWIYGGTLPENERVLSSDDPLICDRLPTNVDDVNVYDLVGARSSASYPYSYCLSIPTGLCGSTASAIRTYINANPYQFCMKLKSPVSYELTTDQVIHLLSGQNIVYADCGPINKLVYAKQQSGLMTAEDKNKLDNLIEGAAVKDVKINSTSLLTNGVANIPIATDSNLGVVSNGGMGIGINSSGYLYLNYATDSIVKTGTSVYNAITAGHQHEAAFYGLAKAAGDSTQSASSNAVGVYTANAKAAIQSMLDIPNTAATTTTMGLMSTTDKTKLDSLETIDPYETINTPSSVITVDDAIDNAPMGAKIAVEPIQDLHGYSNPWVGGAGKNKLNMTLESIKSVNTTGTWNGKVYTVNSMTVTVNTDSDGNVTGFVFNGQPSANTWFTFRKFDSDEITVDGTLKMGGYMSETGNNDSKWAFQLYFKNNNGSNIVVSSASNSYGAIKNLVETGDTSANYMALVVRSTGSPSNLVIKPMIITSTETNYDFEPYSNICPISGWDKTEVTRTGKNIATTKIYKQNYVLASDGAENSSTNYFISERVPVIGGGKYTVSFVRTSGTDIVRVGCFDSYMNFIERMEVSTTGTTLTMSANTAFIRLSYRNITPDLINIQIEKGKTATTYEAFSDEYTITFPSSAGTVYGGTLTVNADGTGTVAIDKLSYTLNGTETWSAAGTEGTTTNYYYTAIALSNNKFVTDAIISNMYPFASISGSTTTSGITCLYSNARTANVIYCRPYNITNTTVSAFKTYLSSNNLQVVCGIETPIVYMLATNQVIRSLLGTNNIWADTGNVQQLLYTKLTSGLISTEDKYKLDNIVSIDPYVIRDIPSSVVEIEDATETPAKELQVAIAPLQDLHGYDHPWVGGAGKNKAESVHNPDTTTRYYVALYVEADLQPSTTYTFSFDGTAGNQYYLNENMFTADDAVTVENGKCVFTATTKSSLDKTSQSQYWTGYGWVILKNNKEQTSSSVFNNLQLELGSIATSYAPYENICPISGWTGAEVVGTKNLYNKNAGQSGYFNADGTIHTSNVWKYQYVPVTPNTQYTVQVETAIQAVNHPWFDINKNFISNSGIHANGTFTSPSNAAYFGICGNTNSTDNDILMVERGSVASAYSPFCSYSITFPTEAGTVYGGTLTVNQDGTGSFVVDRLTHTVPTITSLTTNQAGTLKYTVINIPSGISIASETSEPSIISERYKTYISGQQGSDTSCIYRNTGSNYIIRFPLSATTDSATAEASGSKVVYKLATPQSPISLTTDQVIRLLSGQNTVYADCGPINKLIYTKQSSGLMTAEDKYKLDQMPAVTAADNGKILRVVNGAWAAVSLPMASEVSF